MASECGRPTNPNCEPKCCPILRQPLPNQNWSHVTSQPIKEQGKVECIQPACNAQVQGFPVCASQDQDTCKGCYDAPTGHQRQCECQNCVRIRKENAADFCPQHTEGNEWQDLKKYSSDPEIQEMRDRLASSACVKESLKWCPDDETLTNVERRFRQGKTGLLGRAVVHYGAAQDCDFPKEMTHGVKSEVVNQVKKLVNPPIKPWPDQLDLELKESIYASNRWAPIGKSHDQLQNLPAKIEPVETTFGKPTDKSINAGLLVNPPKDRFQVECESKCCSQLYRMTHGNYKPGEQICRNYDEPFSRLKAFGYPTPCDVAGRWTKKVMSTWRSCKPDLPYVNKVYADHLDMRYPKLGQPQDKNCIGRTRGLTQTFGSRSKHESDERPISEVIFNRCPNPGAQKAQSLMQSLKSWIESVRKTFKHEVGPDLESLYEALLSRDSERGGTVDWNGFISSLKEVKLPCLEDKQEFMECLAYVNIYHPMPCDKINYYSLMDYIKGHEDPMFNCRTTTLKPWYLPWTNGCIHFRTSYSDFASNWCMKESCLQHLREQKVHGMPRVRKDRVPRKIRGARDTTNYGDDGDAYSLIWPSVYTSRGITCRDVFCELDRAQMLRILCEASVNITYDEFEKVWKKAEELDPDGKDRVCYQTFREALHIVRDTENKMYGYSEETKIQDCCHGVQEDVCCLCRCRKRPNPNGVCPDI